MVIATNIAFAKIIQLKFELIISLIFQFIINFGKIYDKLLEFILITNRMVFEFIYIFYF